MSHKFNQSIFNKTDKVARDTLINILPTRLTNNDDKYGVDLIFDTRIYNHIEVEVVLSWGDDKDGPFGGNVKLFERKLRYDNDTLFIQLNNKQTKLVIFSRKQVDIDRYYTTVNGSKSYWIKQYRVFNINEFTFKDVLKYYIDCDLEFGY